MDLTQKTVLVTGAARRLGRAVAVGFAAAGADMVVHYHRSKEQAQSTVEDLQALGVGGYAVSADLSKEGDVVKLFSSIRERSGTLDVLVNSAAGFVRRELSETTVQEWDDVQRLNLRAPYLCTQHASRLMENGGAIVNIADLSGVQAWRGYAAHGVAKAGLIHLTRCAAVEMAPRVRVNCVVPGAVLPAAGGDAERLQAKAERLPIGRSGTPEDVARAVVFLASQPFITGAVLPVDGGEHLTLTEAAE